MSKPTYVECEMNNPKWVMPCSVTSELSQHEVDAAQKEERNEALESIKESHIDELMDLYTEDFNYFVTELSALEKDDLLSEILHLRETAEGMDDFGANVSDEIINKMKVVAKRCVENER